MKSRICKYLSSAILSLVIIASFLIFGAQKDAFATESAPEWAIGNSSVTATFNYDLKNSVYGENGWYYGAKTENTDWTTKNSALAAEGFWTEDDYLNMSYKPLFYQTVAGATNPSINLGYYSDDFMMSSHAVQGGETNTQFYGRTLSGYNVNSVDSTRFDFSGLVYTFTDIETGNYFKVKIYSPGGSDPARERSYIAVSYNGGNYSANSIIAYYFGGRYCDSYANPNKYTFNFLNVKYDKDSNTFKYGPSLTNSLSLLDFNVPAFNAYKVDMEFFGVKAGKTAGLMVYFLNGFELNGVSNTSGLNSSDNIPFTKTNTVEIVSRQEIVDLRDLVGVYNAVLGEVAETVTFTVKDSNNQSVAVNDGKVVLSRGAYTINATLGEYSLNFNVSVSIKVDPKAEWATGNSTITSTFNFDITNSQYGYVDNKNNGWSIRSVDNNILLDDKDYLQAQSFWTKADYKNLKPLFYESVLGEKDPTINLGYYSGDFSMASTPVQSVACNSQLPLDYYGLIYTFTDTQTGENFKVKIWNNADTDTTASIAVAIGEGDFSNSVTIPMNFGGRYYGTKNQPNSGYFYTLNVKFDQATKSFKYGNRLTESIPIADMGLSGFETYKVDMSFFGVSDGKTAKLCVYYLNGYDLTEDIKYQFVKPQVVLESEIERYAYNNQEVYIPDAIGFDACDGILESNCISINIKSPSGASVQLNNNKILLEEVGDYTVEYVARSLTLDVENTKTFIITVKSAIPVSKITLSGTIPEKLGVGGTLYLPTAQFSLEGSDVDGGHIVVMMDGVVLYGFDDVKVINKIKLDKVGKYKISYVYDSRYGFTNAFSYFVECEEVLTIIDPELPDQVSFNGNGYIFNEGMAKFGEEVIVANISIVSPTGKAVELTSDLLFKPEEIGDYTVTYTAEYQGQTATQEYILPVQISATEMFDTVGDIDEFIPNVKIPYLAAAGLNLKNEGKTGVAVIASATGAKITFKNIIDVTTLKDDNGWKNLIEFQPLTTTDGYNHTNEIIVTLTDVHNPSNQVKIKWSRNTEAFQYAYVLVNPNGFGYYGLDKRTDALVIHKNQYGTNTSSSFYADRYSGKYAFSVFLDYEDKEFGYKTSPTSKAWTIVDADDIAHVGDGKQWSGFTTGEVYLSMEFSAINNVSGAIITEIAGQRLSGLDIVDTIAPSIIVDADSNYLESGQLPIGLVNTAYPIPSARANDVVSGAVDINLAVEYKQSETEWVVVENSKDYFVPEKVGSYRIVWTAKDQYGNQTKKVLGFNVGSSIPDVNVTLEENLVDVFVGEKYYIPKITASGGSGNLKLKTVWLFNGEKIDLDETNVFIPKSVGTLTARIFATDYLGIEVLRTLEIEVLKPNLPVIEVSGVPTSAIKGDQLLLPDFNAIDYQYAEGEDGYYATKKIFVNGTEIDISARSYTVVENAGVVIEVKYVGVGKNGESEKIFNINVLDPVYISDYLIYDSNKIETRLSDSYTEFLSQEDFSIKLPNPVSSKGMIVAFYYDRALLEVGGSIDVLFTDSEEKNLQVKVTVFFIDGKPYGFINGNSSKAVALKDSSDNLVYFIFDSEMAQITDSTGAKLSNIDYLLDGKPFTGFSSKAAMVEFNIKGVEQNTGAKSFFRLNQIGNQRFVTTFNKGEAMEYLDRTAGQISYEFDMNSGSVDFGSIINVSAAKAFDVLQSFATVKVTVQSPTKTLFNNVSIDESFSIKAEEYGYYRITYTVIAGQKTERLPAFSIKVVDKTPPTILVSDTVGEEFNLGDTVSLPSATASDNVTKDIKLFVFVVEPNGRYVDVSETLSYTFAKSGKYKIVYYSIDDDYNTAREEFEVFVKEK